MKNAVDVLTGNRILNVTILAFFVAQGLKVILTLIQEKRFNPERLFGSGGMPSAHSATTCALAVSVAKVMGTASPEFAIAAVFACIVMYDASNVRRAAGEQARILNYIMDHWHDTEPELFKANLKELLGHTPLQVFCGAVLGIGLALVI